MGDNPSFPAGGLETVQAYDEESITAFVAAADAERASLTARLDAALARRTLAEGRLHGDDLENRLGTMLAAAQRMLIDEQRANDLAVTAVLESAEREADALVRAGKAQAEALSAALAAFAGRPAEVLDLDEHRVEHPS